MQLTFPGESVPIVVPAPAQPKPLPLPSPTIPAGL